MKNLSISKRKALTIITFLLLSNFNQTFASRQPKKLCLILTRQDSGESRIMHKGSKLELVYTSDRNTTYKNYTLIYDESGEILAAAGSSPWATITSKLLVGQAIIAHRQSEAGMFFMDFQKIDNDTQPTTISDTVISCRNNQSYTIPAKDIFWKIRMMNKNKVKQKLKAARLRRKKLAEQQSQWPCIIS